MRVVRRRSPRTCNRSRQKRRPARSIAAVLIYLIGFVILLLVVSHYYLIPGDTKPRGAVTFKDKRSPPTRASFWRSCCLSCLSDYCLHSRSAASSGRGRFRRAKPTKYVDAWEESGRRLKLPKKMDGGNDSPRVRPIIDRR